MAAQASTSQVLAKVKSKLKGGWKKARKVAPQARSVGGLPPGLKGAVARCAEFKAALTTKGDPYFTLTGIIVSPPELENRRATASWFINDSDYSTSQDNAEQLANDLGLLYDGEMPEDEAGILDVLKELCDNGVHFIFATNRPRNPDKNPNVIIQGLAEGFEDAHASNGEAGDADDAGSSDEGELVDEAGDEGEPAEEEGVTPAVGDEFNYTFKPKGSKKNVTCKVKLTEVDEGTGKVAFATVKHKPKLQWKNIGWDKLEPIEE